MPKTRAHAAARARRQRAEATLGEIGEFGFLDALLPLLGVADPRIRIGLGDDCAVVDSPSGSLVLTTDTLVQDIHFRRDWIADRRIGRRAFLVNASDIAAMGARTLWCLVGLGAPTDCSERALLEMMAGVAEAAAEVGAAVVGGNVSRSPKVFLSVALVGTVDVAPVARSGARPGDRLFVSGTLGGAAYAVRELAAGRRLDPRTRAMRAYAEPPAQTMLGPRLAGTGGVSAMIDLSDGFSQDLSHILDASGVGAVIDVPRLPLCPGLRLPLDERLQLAASGGDDYELLFSVRPESVARVRAVGRALGVPLAEVGSIAEGSGARASDPRWQTLLDGARGHDHFRAGTQRRSRRRRST